MEKRLDRLAVLYQADPLAIDQASWDIQLAIQYPDDAGPTVRAARTRRAHGLDDAGLERAITLALIRCGSSRDEAAAIATLGLEEVLMIAADTEGA